MKNQFVKFFLVGLLFISCSTQRDSLSTPKDKTPATDKKPTVSTAETIVTTNAIKNEIIVYVVPTGDIKNINHDFREYELKTIKTISINPPLYLISFNDDNISGRKMLDMLNGHREVKQAEMNRKTNNR